MAGDALKTADWLVADLLRVEELIRNAAEASPYRPVSDPSSHLVKAGGKRVRPALVLLAARAGAPGRATDLAAAAIELVHVATLYHDDVIDGTKRRRNVPTTHERWGTDVAILAGDYLFARGCLLGATAGGEVPSILASAIGNVCEGQILEMQTVGDPGRSPEEYVEVILKKTSSLFRAACELGVTTSDAPPQFRETLGHYGENLGMAFQIVDDLLDLVGDPTTTGKEPGTDLRDGVFTAPILLAISSDRGLAARLAAGERELATILPTLRRARGLELAYEMARGYGTRARQALAELPQSEWRDIMHTIVDGVIAQVPLEAVA